jgi:hypothetical protein
LTTGGSSDAIVGATVPASDEEDELEKEVESSECAVSDV